MGQWPLHKENHSLGYFRRDDIPFQFALAEAFTICDAYHCAIQASTNPNRTFQWCGHHDGLGRAGGPVIGNSHDNFPEKGGDAASYTWPTYVERLQAAGVSWQVYQDMENNYADNPLAGFESFRQAWRVAPGHDAELRARGVSTRDIDLLRRDVTEGRLPQVSFIVAGGKDSEHPGDSSPAQGAAYIARVLDALTANRTVWSRTALLINFDENDGFFDHVPPPAPPSADPQRPGEFVGASAVSTEGEYHLHASPGNEQMDLPELRGRPYGLGPRVPMYVVSPWSRGGWVDSEVFDHTSVLRLIERRFGVAVDVSPWRRAVCGDLVSAFDFRQEDSRPFFTSLPSTASPAQRAAMLPGRTPPAFPEDLEAPVQDTGVRRSRAVPYRPDVQLTVDEVARNVQLVLACEGAAAVLHVYDRLALDAMPRRYTVAPGKPLTGIWPLHDGRYDLWLLGPNGFHRQFAGVTDGAGYEARMALVAEGAQRMQLQLLNTGAAPIELQLRPGAYTESMRPGRIEIRAGESRALHWPLAPTGGWYDIWLQAPGQTRRLAGRVESGAASISDPAMGGAARLHQEESAVG
jgi:phospholipase C